MTTSGNPNFNNLDDKKPETKGATLFSYVTDTIGRILDTPLSKSFPIIGLVGYIIISFSGNILIWEDLLRYITIIAFCLALYYLILLGDYCFIDRKVGYIKKLEIYFKVIFLFLDIYIYLIYLIPLIFTTLHYPL